MAPPQQVAVITGGRGFVARYLVRKLLEQGSWAVRILDLPPALLLDDDETFDALGSAVQTGRASYMSVDIRDAAAVLKACQGADVVFHMAAPSTNNLDFHTQYSVNVTGTKNVIEACVQQRVRKLIYTSSASVVFNGRHDIKDGDERLPYPEEPLDAYSETKAQAEMLVLAANGRRGLATAALRPSGVFGPGDPIFLPLTCKNAAAGRLKFIIGSGENQMDFTYVENVAYAHLRAESALEDSSSAGDGPAGKAYFITNGEPRPFWGFLTELITQLGYDPPRGKLPARPILALAYASEAAGKALRPLGLKPSDFTPSRVRIVSTWRTFSCARAARLLAYAPPVPLQEGVRRTLEASQHLRREKLSPLSAAGAVPAHFSRAHDLLGGGRAADILLWRDVRTSAAVLAAALLLASLAAALHETLVSLAASLALVALLVLFAYRHLHPYLVRNGVSLPELPAKWEVSEAAAARSARHVKEAWNTMWHARLEPPLYRLFVLRDAIFFVKVVAMIAAVEWLLGGWSAPSLLIAGTLAAFSLPLAYERYWW